jgi:hypothetical protein
LFFLASQGSRASRELQTRLGTLETRVLFGSTPKPASQIPRRQRIATGP